MAEVEYSTDIMQLLEMTGMTETVGMVPITNLDEPGGFRIGKVRKILDFRIILKYVDIYILWQDFRIALRELHSYTL